MSIKSDLHEKTSVAKEKIRQARGTAIQVASHWEEIVENFLSKVYAAAELGKLKYFLDMEDSNQETIWKVSLEVKERLGDVLVIVSPRGIEANWEILD